MENKVRKISISSIALSIACISAISVYLVLHFRRRNKNTTKTNSSCYLFSESKPQSSFKRLLADNSFSPFKHLLLSPSSPNSAISSNLHPYESQIMTLLKNPQIDYGFFNEISMMGISKPHVWVESEAQLQELVNILSDEQLFAVDTEQHSLRSFLGFTALVQISTQKEDYLIDTIALHDRIHLLQSVFSDPNIVKVFHGADNDVLWLQRDFHIYVVNLFDTAKACEILSKPHKSLAYLLETYCGVTTNKLLQRGDWRQRPLPEEMVEYARLDAHYLLYIARCLIKELEAKDEDISQSTESEAQDVRFHYLPEASRRSNATSLQLFCKESDVFPGESVASSIISRYLNGQGAPSNNGGQFQDHIRKLCAWRDLMARVHDESLRYVLSDQAIIALAEKRPQSKREIYTIISLAEIDHDLLTSSSSAMSPSLVICSHWEDVKCLLEEGQSKSVDDILQNILHNHLGSKGSCSLSLYNYNLLSGSNLKLANRSMQNGVRSGKQFVRKASRELFVQKFSCKAPVYHNCRIFASDGRLLCYCDRRKLEWYLNRNLAKLMEDDPPAIMLLFEPKGRPEDEDNDFYIKSKSNMCVSCGESNHYLRYRIIPSCYRIHFPEHLKSHRSHDIVLLCVDCHEVAHAAAEKYKRQVAKEFGVPLYVRRVLDSGELPLTETPKSQEQQEAGVSPLQLRTAAMALLRHGQRMPSKRREELIEIVRRYYGGREISHEDLENALLVGMSPYERRKIEKKRGDLHKKTMANTLSEAVTRNDFTEDQASYEELVVNPNTNVETTSSSAGGISDFKQATLLDSGNIYATANSPKSSGRKRNSKVSLLGHGPHGKEVVDLLLKNSGDDGIHQFCQRWRQVFVDALQPRYLPAGWDIRHSGRRAFGEFSVYNPSKKAIDDQI